MHEPSRARTVAISPVAEAVNGVLAIPGSKSMGNRAIILAAFSEGESRLQGILDSDDARAAFAAVRALGVACHPRAGNVRINGNGGQPVVKTAEIHIGSSGTVGRFLPGLLAAAPSGEWRIVSSEQLAKRPLGPLVEGLGEWGARLERPEPGASFPLIVRGGGLSGGEAAISVAASSQFASGLLMAGPLCREAAAVIVRDVDPDETYLDMTFDLMRRFGADFSVSREGGILRAEIPGRQIYRAVRMTIEADANTACYFLALAALTGGTVAISNLNPASRQPGVKFLDVLARLGATVTRSPSASVSGGARPLRGGFSIDMRAMSEMALTLGVLAVFADAPVSMTNLGHIRGHESDRIAALSELLGKVGVRTEEGADCITVHPLKSAEVRRVVVNPRDDHRIAMSFALLGAAANGITIENPECVGKTCPGFFDLLCGLGVEIAYS